MTVRAVVEAVDPSGQITSVRELASHIGDTEVSSVRRIVRDAASWRVVHQRLIRHVFVLMLKNRSFDHLLGYTALSGTDASTGAPRTADGLDGASYSNVDPIGPVTFPRVAAGKLQALSRQPRSTPRVPERADATLRSGRGSL